MKPRILLNLGVFAVIATVMITWAVLTLLPIRFGEKPFRVEVEFASSPGLRSGLEVDYLGVPIGQVDTIRLRPGRVNVSLLIDAGTEVPGNVIAQVFRKSAVGEPYVELSSPPSAAAAPRLADGDVIPLARTTSAVQYQRLFDSAGKMLGAVEPADLKTVTRELSVGLNGRGQDLRDTLADLDHATKTIADQAGVLDALAVQLTALAGTLSAKGPQLAAGTNDLAAFTATLRDSRKSIDALLTDAPGFLDQTNALLKDSRPGLRCLFTALGTPAPSLFNQRNSQAVHHAMSQMHGTIPGLLDDVATVRPESTYIRLKLLLTVGGPVPNAQEYPERLPGATVPPQYICRDTAATRNAEQPGQGNRNRPAGKPAGTEVDRVFKTIAPTPAAAAEDGDDRWLPLLPPIAAALILLGTAAHTVRRMRNRPHRRKNA
ncbi:MCE family protein [Actinomadura craniellae]|uniref:MCE family protein n=1 Tax=Actinomadura craniellae TaxID=2231787 RepID=A0A365HCZ7_9ACTN|nr:MCE family protein [Actinomadura craniellae]RAY16981.1 MCE family protein [Actinomadura craniellae]